MFFEFLQNELPGRVLRAIIEIAVQRYFGRTTGCPAFLCGGFQAVCRLPFLKMICGGADKFPLSDKAAAARSVNERAEKAAK
jgi:hypothetical protein